MYLDCGFNSSCMHPCFMSSLVKCLAPFSLYFSSSSVDIAFLVGLMAALAVVMSMIIRSWDGSAFGVNTTLDIHSFGSSTGSMMSAPSSSRIISSKCCLFGKGIHRWAWTFGVTASSIMSSTWRYLCFPIPWNTFGCFPTIFCTTTFDKCYCCYVGVIAGYSWWHWIEGIAVRCDIVEQRCVAGVGVFCLDWPRVDKEVWSWVSGIRVSCVNCPCEGADVSFPVCCYWSSSSTLILRMSKSKAVYFPMIWCRWCLCCYIESGVLCMPSICLNRCSEVSFHRYRSVSVAKISLSACPPTVSRAAFLFDCFLIWFSVCGVGSPFKILY